jgi:N-acetylglucosamine kinase
MIKAVFDDEDNLVKCEYDTNTAWDMIKSHFGVENRRDMLEHCYASFQKSFYARLCQKMSVAASNGDELCQKIFTDAGRQLGKMIAALLPRVDPKLIETGHLSIICVGSVWLSWELLQPGLIKELRQHKIPFDLRLLKLKPNVSMAVGAFYMAADSVDFPMPRDYSQNYEIFFNYEGGNVTNGTNGTNGNHI